MASPQDWSDYAKTGHDKVGIVLEDSELAKYTANVFDGMWNRLDKLEKDKAYVVATLEGYERELLARATKSAG